MTVQSVPQGYTAVTPWIIGHDTAGLIDYLERAFGAHEVDRFEMADGTIGHAELLIGDAHVMAFDSPEGWPATPAFLRLYVEDAEAVHRRAVEAGGTSVTEVTRLFFGDDVGRVRDPYGNVWWIQARIEDVDEAETRRRLSDPAFTGAMAYLTGSLAQAAPGPQGPRGRAADHGTPGS